MFHGQKHTNIMDWKERARARERETFNYFLKWKVPKEEESQQAIHLPDDLYTFLNAATLAYVLRTAKYNRACTILYLSLLGTVCQQYELMSEVCTVLDVLFSCTLHT